MEKFSSLMHRTIWIKGSVVEWLFVLLALIILITVACIFFNEFRDLKTDIYYLKWAERKILYKLESMKYDKTLCKESKELLENIIYDYFKGKENDYASDSNEQK